MWSVSVVPAEVAGEGAGAVCAGVVGEAVGPFALQRIDQCFRFAVGLWSPRAGVAASDAEFGAGLTPEAGAVSVAVVGEHAFNGYPVLTEPAGSAAEELGAGCGRLGREQLGVGESAVVVDRDVEVLPAGAAAQVAGRGTENPFADGPEAAQLLDVDVHELARAAALVAAHRAPLRTRKPRATVPAKHLPDREAGSPSWPATISGPAFAYSRAARMRCSSSGESRRGCRFGTGGRSTSAPQPPSRKRPQ